MTPSVVVLFLGVVAVLTFTVSASLDRAFDHTARFKNVQKSREELNNYRQLTGTLADYDYEYDLENLKQLIDRESWLEEEDKEESNSNTAVLDRSSEAKTLTRSHADDGQDGIDAAIAGPIEKFRGSIPFINAQQEPSLIEKSTGSQKEPSTVLNLPSAVKELPDVRRYRYGSVIVVPPLLGVLVIANVILVFYLKRRRAQREGMPMTPRRPSVLTPQSIYL